MLEVENGVLQTIDFKLGYSCNNNCIHCVVSNKRKYRDLSLDDVKRYILSFVKKYEKIDLVLTGGEFTLRKDVNDVLDFLDILKKSSTIRNIHLQTNGRRLSEAELTKRCLRTIDSFLIPFHGYFPELHDVVTRQVGSFCETVVGVKNLLKFRKKETTIWAQIVINRYNYPVLKSICEYVCEHLCLNGCNIAFPHPNGNAYTRAVIPTYFEIKRCINEATKYCLNNNIDFNLEQFPLCVFDKDLAAVAWAKISSGKHNVVGYDKGCGSETGMINYAETIPSELRKYSSCTECQYDSLCVGVWKEYLKLYPNYPLTPIHPIAKKS